MRRIRTLIIHPTPAPYRTDLFNRLADELDLDVIFQRPEINYHRALDQKALRAALRCRTGALPGNRVILDRDVPLGLGRFLRERDPEVVVTMEFSGVSLLTARAKRRAGKRFGHVIWSDENPASFRGHGIVRRRLRAVCSRDADALIVCSAHVADLFARAFSFPQERIHRCGVHQAPESVRARLVAAWAERPDLPVRLGVADRSVVLYVGRLAPEKNLPVALEAFARVHGHDPSVVFLLVGTGALRQVLETQAAGLGVGPRVRFAGHLEGAELFGCYRMASLLVLPSTHEPYGAVVNEALICGVPVACSVRAGAAQLIRPGVNGALLDPADDGSIDRAFEALRSALAPAAELWKRERADLMPVRFDDDVAGFVAAVRGAAARAGAGGSGS